MHVFRSHQKKRLRSAWSHMRKCVMEGRFDSERKGTLEKFELERSGIIAERAAAHLALERQRTQFAVIIIFSHYAISSCIISVFSFFRFFVFFFGDSG